MVWVRGVSESTATRAMGGEQGAGCGVTGLEKGARRRSGFAA
jgi:hypothetical protein